MNRGYFPRGGGEIKVQVSPLKQINPINMTNFGTIKRITGRAFVAGVIPFKVSTLVTRNLAVTLACVTLYELLALLWGT